MAYDWLSYANQGATRNLPLAPDLVDALGFLPELGVRAEVFSGGQDPNGRTVGSTRHNHGGAGDFRFYDAASGRMLNWASPEDRPVFEEIVRRGRENGITGIGAGDGYMSPGTMHLGFGTPAVWGAGGKGANAPDWLRAAYNGAEAPPYERKLDMGRPTMAGYPSRTGGLGGLGGMVLPEEPQAPEGFAGYLSDPGVSDVLRAAFTSMMGSPSNAPLSGMGEILPQMQAQTQKRQIIEDARRRENRTLAWLQQNRPDLAGMVGAGMDIGQAASLAAQERSDALRMAETQADLTRTAGTNRAYADYLQGQGADDSLVTLAENGQGAEAFRLFKSGNGGAANYGTTPVYGTDADGNTVVVQMGDNGTAVQTQMPQGFRPLSPYDRSFSQAAGAAGGKLSAEQGASAPSEIQAGENALTLIRELRSDPNRETGTGRSAFFNFIPASAGYDYQNKVDQARSGAFLTAIQDMKGLGALSEGEGKAATAAITRMNTATSEKAFLDALDAYEIIVEQGINRARGRLGQGRQDAAPAAASEAMRPDANALPSDVTEEDIQHTMQVHGLTREQVLERLR